MHNVRTAPAPLPQPCSPVHVAAQLCPMDGWVCCPLASSSHPDADTKFTQSVAQRTTFCLSHCRVKDSAAPSAELAQYFKLVAGMFGCRSTTACALAGPRIHKATYDSLLCVSQTCVLAHANDPTWSTLCTAVLQAWLALYAEAASAMSSSSGCLLVPNMLMRNVSINSLSGGRGATTAQQPSHQPLWHIPEYAAWFRLDQCQHMRVRI
jgi:hypothetical protein